MKLRMECKHDDDVIAEIQQIIRNHSGVVDMDLTKDGVVVCSFEDRNDAVRISELFAQAEIVTDIKLEE